MPLADVATAAVNHFAPADAVVATAIAGAESGYGANMFGDPLSEFSGFSDYAVYAQYSVNGYCSFGPWQILLRWHYDQVTALAGTSDPVSMAGWLLQYDNAAAAARSAYDSGGWGQWTTYSSGAYQTHLGEAQAAVNAALGTSQPSGGGSLPVPSQLYVLKPASAAGPYAVTLDWGTPAPDQWVDVSLDANFAGYSNKHVGSGAQTVCPDGFSDNAQLIPGNTYYWRIWNGQLYAHGPSWNVPSEVLGPPAPAGGGGGGFSSGGGAAPSGSVNLPIVQPGPGLQTQPALGDTDWSPAIQDSKNALVSSGQNASQSAARVRSAMQRGN